MGDAACLVHATGRILRLVDVVISHVGGTTTAAERKQAQAWLERQLEVTEKAVTQIRLLLTPTKS